MPAYTVKFHYGEDVFEYTNPYSPENRTKESEQEILKEFAGMLIKAFHTEHPEIEMQIPSRIQLFRENECILYCDDLTEKSFNRVK